ncbi:hypothetical protein BC943DRAFT_331230 [Umbelopsis sp. AD052]|nr:hypothetical protein BC943DRAFT_331230 [Umbelopsis sp. AD052]
MAMAHQPLNEFEIEEARECFKTLDPESKGVTATELMGAMKVLGKNYSDEEIQSMISSADKHGKGRVDFEDFLALLENQKAKGSHEAAFVEVFEAIDSDKDGNITVQDIANYMASRGENMPEEDIKQMVHAADVSGDGRVNYEEFVKILTHSRINTTTLV